MLVYGVTGHFVRRLPIADDLAAQPIFDHRLKRGPPTRGHRFRLDQQLVRQLNGSFHRRWVRVWEYGSNVNSLPRSALVRALGYVTESGVTAV